MLLHTKDVPGTSAGHGTEEAPVPSMVMVIAKRKTKFSNPIPLVVMVTEIADNLE